MMNNTARWCLAGLLLLALPLAAQAEDDATPAQRAVQAERALEPAARAEAPEEDGAAAADAEAAPAEIEESFSPTERVPADAVIRFPVDI
jgi:hypothetical protein